MNNNGKIALGVLAGIAAGAAIGILFAPDKGSATRKRILDKGGDYAKDLKNKFNELYSSASDKVDSLKNEAMNMAGKGKAKAEDMKTGMA